MIVVLGKPIGWLMDQLTEGLTNMSEQPGPPSCSAWSSA